jgi:hypothetical protein
MEILLQSQSLLTHTLTNARNENEITPTLRKEYNEALEKLEVSLYPDIRKGFLIQSHKNLISIMKQEQKYFELIEKINAGESINTNESEDSSIESDTPKKAFELKNIMIDSLDKPPPLSSTMDELE